MAGKDTPATHAAARAGIGFELHEYAHDRGADSYALEAAAGEGKTTVNAAFVRKFYDRVAPGIYGEFDAPAMLPLIAPRPHLVINGDSDPRTPMAGVRESAAAAERAYAAAGAKDKFVLRVLTDVGHENTPEIEREMVAWFERWLGPAK